MMLDLVGLPKNANGFRTTHTCELCGFEPKTKNKYREKQDHLVMKHFKERIDKIFPHCRPYSCPNPDCDFTGKDKQALLRHYTGKHGVLELFLREALAEKGIQYQLSDSAKRKSQGHSEQAARRTKEARLSSCSSPPLTTSTISTTTTTLLKEESILSDSQQQQQQYNCYSSPLGSPMGSPLSSSSSAHESIMMADTTTPLGTQDFIAGDLMFMTGGPASATAPVTTCSNTVVAAAGAARRMMLPTVPTTKLPSMATVFTRSPSQTRCDVEALLASFQPIDAQLILSLPNNSSAGTILSASQQQQQQQQQQQLISGRGGGGGRLVGGGDLDSHVVSSTTPDFFLPAANSILSDEHPGKLVLNDNIMWCGGSTAALLSEAAQTVPVQYMDPSDGGFVNLSDIDFDYLYPATVEPTPPPPAGLTAASNQERQLSFSML